VLTHKKPKLDAIVSALWISLEKPERWVGLSEIEPHLPDPIFYETFVDVWTNSESNHLNLPLIDELIDRRGVCASNVMPGLSVRDRQLFEDLKEDPIVYRGATVEEPYLDYAWTADRKQALWFARRCSRATPALITGTVDPETVLFAYAGRGESEIAVRTREVADKSVEPIGAYRSERTSDAPSAVVPGSLDALFDPVAMMTLRFRAMITRDGETIANVRRFAYRDVEQLEQLGFTSAPRARRQLLDRVDWDRLGAPRSRAG
jgi:hypothetical protein